MNFEQFGGGLAPQQLPEKRTTRKTERPGKSTKKPAIEDAMRIIPKGRSLEASPLIETPTDEAQQLKQEVLTECATNPEALTDSNPQYAMLRCEQTMGQLRINIGELNKKLMILQPTFVGLTQQVDQLRDTLLAKFTGEETTTFGYGNLSAGEINGLIIKKEEELAGVETRLRLAEKSKADADAEIGTLTLRYNSAKSAVEATKAIGALETALRSSKSSGDRETYEDMRGWPIQDREGQIQLLQLRIAGNKDPDAVTGLQAMIATLKNEQAGIRKGTFALKPDELYVVKEASARLRGLGLKEASLGKSLEIEQEKLNEALLRNKLEAVVNELIDAEDKLKELKGSWFKRMFSRKSTEEKNLQKRVAELNAQYEQMQQEYEIAVRGNANASDGVDRARKAAQPTPFRLRGGL